MSTDRELLELAAKAAGYESTGWEEYYCSLMNGECFVQGLRLNRTEECIRNPWNPLTDDGDALRLAVDLQIHFARYDSYSSACVLGQPDNEQTEWQSKHICKYAATRRAIVRAAAEIGRAMK